MIESNSPLFEVEIENYNGPLDVLLDLAKAQKVNLEEISITRLADQFYEYISTPPYSTSFSQALSYILNLVLDFS